MPVFFFLKVVVSGFAAPLGWPKVAPGACREWEPPSRLNLPAMFEHVFFEVVFKPKVEAVGSRS